MSSHRTYHKILFIFSPIIIFGILYFTDIIFRDKYVVQITNANLQNNASDTDMVKEVLPLVPDLSVSTKTISHITIPDEMKAVYISRLGVTSEIIKDRMRDMIDKGQINAIIIDAKDNTGETSFGNNLKNFIDELHSKNIYVIARIAVFQDDKYAKENKSEALLNKSGGLWSNVPGSQKSYWLDPASTSTWDYNLEISRIAYHDYGFDEINLDYIRYPGDGPINQIAYTHSKFESKNSTSSETRRNNVRDFYKYITTKLKEDNIKVSADIFGFVTIADYDFGIGQVLGDAVEYFDYVAPMIYPSHYTPGTLGYDNPAKHPYEIVEYSMGSAMEKSSTTLGTSTAKWRPWLQDFDLGAVYSADMVKKQIDALESLGIRSYMLWNAANRYHGEAMSR